MKLRPQSNNTPLVKKKKKWRNFVIWGHEGLKRQATIIVKSNNQVHKTVSFDKTIYNRHIDFNRTICAQDTVDLHILRPDWNYLNDQLSQKGALGDAFRHILDKVNKFTLHVWPHKNNLDIINFLDLLKFMPKINELCLNFEYKVNNVKLSCKGLKGLLNNLSYLTIDKVAFSRRDDLAVILSRCPNIQDLRIIELQVDQKFSKITTPFKALERIGIYDSSLAVNQLLKVLLPLCSKLKALKLMRTSTMFEKIDAPSRLESIEIEDMCLSGKNEAISNFFGEKHDCLKKLKLSGNFSESAVEGFLDVTFPSLIECFLDFRWTTRINAESLIKLMDNCKKLEYLSLNKIEIVSSDTTDIGEKHKCLKRILLDKYVKVDTLGVYNLLSRCSRSIEALIICCSIKWVASKNFLTDSLGRLRFLRFYIDHNKIQYHPIGVGNSHLSPW